MLLDKAFITELLAEALVVFIPFGKEIPLVSEELHLINSVLSCFCRPEEGG